MEIFDTTQLALGAALRGANARQAALAGNLANVDTPGYVRRDVDFHATLQGALGAGADPSSAGFTAEADTAAPVRALRRIGHATPAATCAHASRSSVSRRTTRRIFDASRSRRASMRQRLQ